MVMKSNKILRLVLIVLLGSVLTVGKQSKALPHVEIATKLGKIILEIDTINARVTAKNFLHHASVGTYNNAVFYRVVKMGNQPKSKVKIEVIQGGLFTDEEIEKHPVIPHESTNLTGLKHLNGTISMARAAPGTASTEFFICIGDQPELDFDGMRNPDRQGFAAFGKVVQGMDVVRQIQQLADKGQLLERPVEIYKMQIKTGQP